MAELFVNEIMDAQAEALAARATGGTAAVLATLHAAFGERDPAFARALSPGLREDCRHLPQIGRAAGGCRGRRTGLPRLPLRVLSAPSRQQRAGAGNRELERGSRAVQVFPSSRSLIRMMGAVFSEMGEAGRPGDGSPRNP